MTDPSNALAIILDKKHTDANIDINSQEQQNRETSTSKIKECVFFYGIIVYFYSCHHLVIIWRMR